MSNQIKNDYVPPSNVSAFFIPHIEANHLNAQDVAFELISGAKNISVATFQCFKNGNELMIDAKIIANLIVELQTKLEMIEKILPLAFESGEV